MNNSLKRLLSMVVAVAMFISSFNVMTINASNTSFIGDNTVVSGSSVDVAGFYSNPITSPVVFEPDADSDVSNYAPAYVDGYYTMNNITLLGSQESSAAIDQSVLGAEEYEDGSFFNYSARFLTGSTDKGNVIAFATDKAAKVKVYAVAMNADSAIGIVDGIAPSVTSESDFIAGQYQVADKGFVPTIYEFYVTNGGQYSIAATDAYDINRVEVTPVDDEIIMDGEVSAVAGVDVPDITGTLPSDRTYVLKKTGGDLSNPSGNIGTMSGLYATYAESSDVAVRLQKGEVDRYLDIIPSVSGTVTLEHGSSNNGIQYGAIVNDEVTFTTIETADTYSFDVTANQRYRITGATNSNTHLTSITLTAGTTETKYANATVTVTGASTSESDITISPAKAANGYEVGKEYTVTSANYNVTNVAVDGTGATGGTNTFKVAENTTTITVTLEAKSTPSGAYTKMGTYVFGKQASGGDFNITDDIQEANESTGNILVGIVFGSTDNRSNGYFNFKNNSAGTCYIKVNLEKPTKVTLSANAWTYPLAVYSYIDSLETSLKDFVDNGDGTYTCTLDPGEYYIINPKGSGTQVTQMVLEEVEDTPGDREYANVVAKSNGGGSYTFDFTAEAGKYAPTKSNPAYAYGAYVESDTDDLYVQYTDKGAVVTDNTTTGSNTFYMPLHASIEDSLVTITGNVTSEYDGQTTLLRFATAANTGIAIRNDGQNLLIREDVSGTNNNSGSIAVSTDNGVDYTFVIDLVNGTATLTAGGKSVKLDLSDEAAAAAYTQLSVGTAGSNVFPPTTLSNITYTVETSLEEANEKYVWDYTEKQANPKTEDGTIYEISGNLKDKTALKMESSSSIVVNNPVPGTLTLKFRDSGKGTSIKINGKEYTDQEYTINPDGTITIELAEEGPYEITRGNGETWVEKLTFVPGSTANLGGIRGYVYYIDDDGAKQYVPAGTVVTITDEEGDSKTYTVNASGLFSTGMILPEGKYTVEVNSNSDFIGTSATVTVTAGDTTHKDLEVKLRDNTTRTVKINLTNNTGAAGTLVIHDDALDAGTNAATISYTADASQTFTVELPDGEYMIYVLGIAYTVTVGDIMTVSGNTTHNVTIDIDEKAIEPIEDGVTYLFGSSNIYKSEDDIHFEIENTKESDDKSNAIKLGDNNDYIMFAVGETMIVDFNVDNAKAVLINAETGEVVIPEISKSNGTFTVPAGTYKLMRNGGNVNVYSIKGTKIKQYSGSIEITNNTEDVVTVYLTNITTGEKITIENVATGFGTYPITDATPGTYKITSSDGSVSGTTQCTIDEDEFTIEDVVINTTVKLTVQFISSDSSDVSKVTISKNGSGIKVSNNAFIDTEASVGDTYKFLSTSSSINGWEVTAVDKESASVNPGNIVARNGSSNSNRYFTFTVPSDAKNGNIYTIDLTTDKSSPYLEYWNKDQNGVEIPTVGYGQYGFGGDKVDICGGTDLTNARKMLHTKVRYATMADYVNGSYTSNLDSRRRAIVGYEPNQKHILTTADDKAGTTYSLGNQFAILGPDNGEKSFVKFHIDVTGRVYCKVDGSGGTIELYDLTDSKAAKKIGTQSTKIIYEVTNGHDYIVRNIAESGNSYLKSIRLFNPDNIFFNNQAVTAGNLGVDLNNYGLSTESKLTAFINKNIANKSSNLVYRVIGVAMPNLDNDASLNGALLDVAEVGWTIVDADAVDEYNGYVERGEKMPGDSTAIGIYFNPNSLAGMNYYDLQARLQTKKTISINDTLNSGVLKMKADGSDVIKPTSVKNLVGQGNLEAGTLDHYTAVEDIEVAYAVSYFRVSPSSESRYYAIPYTLNQGESTKGYTTVSKSDAGINNAHDALVKMGVVEINPAADQELIQ